MYGAKNSARASYNLPRYLGFIEDCRILNTVNAVAAMYADLKRHLRITGTPIPENDIWIGATCIVYDIPLFTRDHHFSNLPALQQLS
ncbi:PIN domain-containing protein [Dyadobacter sandarakinus]|uniref:PIN domain-containing protein n=1 Tax=Dyadobacter sandarakinus TaxID=2747268 RepID=A0ABX7I4B8_9BACT|nr:PIN domain-containing protein [Dyadobacter sandarakinus]